MRPSVGHKIAVAMAFADKLRRRAELLRRAASHPTQGGRNTDRLLLVVAERLEREAAAANEEEVARDGYPAREAEG
jgi:hypothetical protein